MFVTDPSRNMCARRAACQPSRSGEAPLCGEMGMIGMSRRRASRVGWARLFAVVVVLLATLPARRGEAASYLVRTETVGRASRMQRADLSTAAPRTVMQGLWLEAHDLLGRQDDSLSAALSVRYRVDLGLEAALRGQPAFAGQYNDVRLDLARVRWRPWRGLTLVAGRQWTWGALGTRDMDGVRMTWRQALGAEWIAQLSAHAGRDAQLGAGAWSADVLDVQGLPAADPSKGLSRWIAGGRARLEWTGRSQLEVATQRRWAPGAEAAGEGAAVTVGDARIGASWSVTPTSWLVASADASYLTSHEQLERATVRVMSKAPLASTVSVGWDRRHPWFDTSSIFNIFGANPHDDLHLWWRVPARWARGSFEVRGWYRVFHGDDTGDLGTGLEDATAPGVGLGHHARLRMLGRAVRWSTRATYQHASDDLGGRQFLLDTSARAPFWLPGLSMHTRVLYLHMNTVQEHHRRPDARALSALVGMDVPILGGLRRGGRLSVFVSHQVRSELPASTSLYATVDVEVWP